MSKPSYRIPFVKNRAGHGSSMLDYTTADDGEVYADDRAIRPMFGMPDEWRDNVPFTATVRLTSHGRGRSSVRVYVINVANDDRYSMGIAAFFEAVVKFGVADCKIRGTWAFRKQGANYTLWPIDDA